MNTANTAVAAVSAALFAAPRAHVDPPARRQNTPDTAWRDHRFEPAPPPGPPTANYGTTTLRGRPFTAAVTAPVAAIGLATLAPPGQAHADADQAAYFHLVQSQGIPGTSDQILNNGYQLCYAL